MSREKKKTMYVPDEEILAYNKAKNEAEAQIEADNALVNNEEPATEPIVSVDEAVVLEDTETPANDIVPSVTGSNSNSVKKANAFVRILKKIFPVRSDDKKTVIIKTAAIVAAIALIVSGTYLAVYFGDLSQQDNKIKNVQNIYEPYNNDYTRNEDNQFSKFDKLKAIINPDIIGWITISNTEVNNPVFQTDNNQFYVDHDMDKAYNSYGALFLDYRCRIDPKALTRNQIIYGHNMRYGAMFGTLDEYRRIDFYKKNPLIQFDSLYEQRQYKIFAIMVVNDAEDDTFGYTYSAYRTDFTNDDDFMSWIQHSRDRSLFDTTVDVNTEDEIITLSTCCYDYENARFVILGRLVRDGESAEVDTATAAANSDVIYSKQYYEKKRLPIPKLESSDAVSSEETKKENTSK